jgi:hypothetical protein
MSNNSALTAMGVQNPKQISRFATFMSDHVDILRITYDRKKGSLLPESKKYRFPQLKKSTMVDSGTRQTEVIYESSAEFRNAVSELEHLMDKRDSSDEIRHLIAEEVQHLEEDVAARIDYIKSLVSKV